MINQLVFHIGDPKSGSTSIQKALQLNACEPEAKTIVPQQELNASAFAISLKPGAKNLSERKKLFRLKRDWATQNTGDIGIISSEFFSHLEPEVFHSAMKKYLPEYVDDLRIVAYVRPHLARALSSYSQRLKTGAYFKSFTDFAGSLPERKFLHFHPRFSAWQNKFGERFTLRPFVRDELYSGDVVSDFFREVLQSSSFQIDEFPSFNESLALEELAGLRRIQKQFSKCKVPPYLRLSLGGAIGVELSKRPDRFKGKLKLDRKNAEFLRDAYLDDAKQMDETFFKKPVLQTEMEKSVDEAAGKTQPIIAKRFFSDAKLQRLDSIANEIAQLVTARPKAWRFDYQRKTGQRPAQPEDQLPAADLKNASAVWALLGQVADELTVVSGKSKL